MLRIFSFDSEGEIMDGEIRRDPEGEVTKVECQRSKYNKSLIPVLGLHESEMIHATNTQSLLAGSRRDDT